jgi:hypothetical protein
MVYQIPQPTIIGAKFEPSTSVVKTKANDALRETTRDRIMNAIRDQIRVVLYRIAHRNSPIAVAQKRIAWDMTNDHVMHFHDWSVPPEEEVLASKLILEHAEPWLRNEATTFYGNYYYKNPFGGFDDGVADAGLTQAIGHIGFALRKR